MLLLVRHAMPMKKIHNVKLAGIFIVMLLFSFGVRGQNKTVSPFEQRVTITMHDKTIEVVLTEISRLANITFSYSPEALNASKKISLSIENQPVRYALNTIFDGSVTYRKQGKFVILQPAKQKKENSPAVVEGYLTSSQGDLLTDATVYNPKNKTVATTDDYGYFRLEIDSKNKQDTLKVSKRGFEDALLIPVPGKTTFVNLSLPKESKDSSGTLDQPDFFPSALVNHKLQVNSSNVTETFNRFFQLSFVPLAGTNSLLSGCTSNLISLNILGGYIESVKLLEVGSIMNIVRRNAGVIQAAGIGNFVGGKFTGIQAAGVLNYTRKSFYGLQVAGVSNTTAGNFNGIQAAAVLNLTSGNLTGLQISGLMNSAKRGCEGMQVAGVMNVTGKIKGCQVTGVINTAKKADGLQLSGVLNQTKNGKGAQIAGVINVADTLKGLQVASVLNKANYCKGVQLGVVNIADSCSGTQIGLINICRKGYHQIDVYATETFYTNIAYRGGTKQFYTILMGGYDPRTIGNSPLYTFGAGIGTSFGNRPKLNYDVDLLTQQVASGIIDDNINMLYRLGFGVNYKMAHNFALTLGLTYNFYLVDSSTAKYETIFSKLSPYSISNEPAGTNRNIKTWIGLKAGIRLF